MNMSYDPHNKYSLPYFFGTVGILYNKDKYPHDNFNSCRWCSRNDGNGIKQIRL